MSYPKIISKNQKKCSKLGGYHKSLQWAAKKFRHKHKPTAQGHHLLRCFFAAQPRSLIGLLSFFLFFLLKIKFY